MPRSKPSKGFLAREQHRVLLTLHALLMIAGLLACALVNRRFSPERFWVQWVALGWGALFLAHLAVFSRETIATMGSGGSGRSAGSAGSAGSARSRGSGGSGAGQRGGER